MGRLGFISIVFFLIFFNQYTTAVTCPTKEDIVKNLPNYVPSKRFPCTYTGFVEVDKDTNSNLFYWFYRDQELSNEAPLLMWLNGGPGASSQQGNFLENGPLKAVLTEDKKFTLLPLYPKAWNSIANIVYLDQPVGVGYSYGDMTINNFTQIADHAIKFIKGFYQKHPEMTGRDFFITGQSYGGKYEPVIASAIIDYNKDVSKEEKIPLKGVLIGNGFVDSVTQRLSTRYISLALGSIQFDSIPEIDTFEQRCHAANQRKANDTFNTCMEIASLISTLDGGMDMYDARWPKTNDSDLFDALNQYLNQPDVYKALHVQNSTKETKFSISNKTVNDNLLGDDLPTRILEHQKILDNNLTLLIYVGGLDRRIGVHGAQKWLEKLEWEGMKNFYSSSRNLYYYVSDDNNEIRLGGNFKTYKNLNLLMVYAAGHLVPTTQLALSRNMLSDIIYNNTLLCHEPNNECSLDSKTCEMMNNCSHHGYCITGKCVCHSYHYGADCSITTKELYSITLNLNATGWEYFKLKNEDYSIRLGIKSSKPLILYTRRGDVPSQSSYDWFAHIDGSEEYEFYLSKENSGEFIALFNPDLDYNTSITISVDKDTFLQSLYWLMILFSCLFIICSFVNLIFLYRRHKNDKTDTNNFITSLNDTLITR